MYQFHPQWTKVDEWICSGDIGEVKGMKLNFSFCVESDNDIRLNPLTGGGSLYDVGTYCVHLSRRIMLDEPIQVLAAADFAPDGIVDRSLAGILKFPSNRLVHFDCSIVSPVRQHAEIVGTEGTITVSHPFRPDYGAATITLNTANDQRTEAIQPCNMYALEIEHFNRCIIEGSMPRNSADSSIANMKTVDELYLAAGRTVQS